MTSKHRMPAVAGCTCEQDEASSTSQGLRVIADVRELGEAPQASPSCSS